jgi:hypothetical protein
VPSIYGGSSFFLNFAHASAMYIRKTKTKTADHGDDSYTYRFVESVHEGTQVKQRTLLNLGNDFAIEPATLELMLEGRQGKNPLTGEKPVLIMDADIASAANIAWLSERNYLYLAVSRERDRQETRTMPCWFEKPDRARSPFTAQSTQKPRKPGFIVTPIKSYAKIPLVSLSNYLNALAD